MARATIAAALSLATASAFADAPAFDRPGIAFSTSTLPAGTVSWEQGLPDFERDDDAGVRVRQYSADTNVRIGLAENVEVQVSGAPFNHLDTRVRAVHTTANGAGDLGVALKLALPSGSEKFSWAMLAGATFDTGSRDFTNGAKAYSLATTLGYAMSDVVSGSLYLGVNRSGGVDTWAWSPGLSFAIDDRFGAFVEAGFEKTQHGPSTRVAGGGFTWMATPRLQLDLSMDFGLDNAAPDVQGGVGFSLYFP
jgi:hypothetical protein